MGQPASRQASKMLKTVELGKRQSFLSQENSDHNLMRYDQSVLAFLLSLILDLLPGDRAETSRSIEHIFFIL